MTLKIEVHADGGIRLATPEEDGPPRHIATLEQVRKWVQEAAKRGVGVEVTGAVTAPLARPVVEVASAGSAPVEVTETEPPPWQDGLTALQIAARDGLVVYVTDLLDRGASASAEADPPERSPYRLAMARGHVPVLRALRAAGVADPVTGRRPPGASPDAVVLRAYVAGTRRRVLIGVVAAPVVLGALAAVATADAVPLIVGLVVTVAVLPLVAIVLVALAGQRVAIDGTDLYVTNGLRWRGPVDLRRLTGLGFSPQTRRTPAYLRLVQPDAGTRLVPGSLIGFGKEAAAEIRSQKGVKVLPVGFRGAYLMPGLPRFVGSCVEGTPCVLSPVAQDLMAQSRS